MQCVSYSCLPRRASCAWAPGTRTRNKKTISSGRRISIGPLTVDFGRAALQEAGERARGRSERPEQEKADGVDRKPARACGLTEHGELHRVEDGEEDHLGDAADDERGPQDPDPAPAQHGSSSHWRSAAARERERGGRAGPHADHAPGGLWVLDRNVPAPG